MATLLIQPHSDDAVLFACYQLIPADVLVVTVLRSEKQQQQGVTDEVRQREDRLAGEVVKASFVALDTFAYTGTDARPDWAGVDTALRLVAQEGWDRVISPAYEEGGHEDHNSVAELVDGIWPNGYDEYMTYRRGCTRSKGSLSVIPEPGWRAAKLRAMGCYSSQVDLQAIRPWFHDWDQEWLA